MDIQLRDEVEDSVTGFKGMVTSEIKYLNGCKRYAVQPKVGDDGKIPDPQWIDEPQLILLSRPKAVSANRSVGGTLTVKPPKAREPKR